MIIITIILLKAKVNVKTLKMRIYLAKRQSESTMYLPDYKRKVISPSVFGNINVLKVGIFPHPLSLEEGVINAFKERIQNPKEHNQNVPIPVKEVRYDSNQDNKMVIDSLVSEARRLGLFTAGGKDIQRLLVTNHFRIMDALSRTGVIKDLEKVNEILKWLNQYDEFYGALYEQAEWIGSSAEDIRDNF